MSYDLLSTIHPTKVLRTSTLPTTDDLYSPVFRSTKSPQHDKSTIPILMDGLS